MASSVTGYTCALCCALTLKSHLRAFRWEIATTVSGNVPSPKEQSFTVDVVTFFLG